MDLKTIRKLLEGVFREVFENDALEMTDQLNNEILESWNSLGHIRLMSELEDVFGVTFTLEEIESMSSVSSILAVLSAKA